MYTIELIEDLLDIVFLDADTRIPYRQVQTVLVVPCLQIDIDGLVGLTVFHCIVEQVVDHVLEVHLIHEDGGIDSTDIGIDLTACMLHTERERVGHALHHFVQVEFLLLEHRFLTVEHRHLQYLLHEEAQAFRLIVHHTTQMLGQGRCLGHGLVVEHLCSQ